MIDLSHVESYHENNRIEAKKSLGGLPKSLWETYSAFANTLGGVILLGVEELPDKHLHALDILDPHWLIEDFWRIINNPAFVSANILTEENVQIHMVDGKQIIAITMPKADAQYRPVYIGTDPYRGSYRRCGEGDYRLTKEEVDAMLAQRRERHAL